MIIFPTIILGFIYDVIRLEAADGEIRYHFPLSNWLVNQKPFIFSNKKYAVTHLQKKSKFGFLLEWPFGFHVWYQFKEQEIDSNDNWIPGTEKVLYARTPGHRWDKDLGMIHTGGYIGLHWD